MAENKPGASGAKLDLTTVAGLLVALAAVVGGLILEGGSVKDITQFTAAIIVVGGTMGAVLVSTPLVVLREATGRLTGLFREENDAARALVEELFGYASRARKQGIISLEEDALKAQNPFLRKALTLAVDGTDIQELRSMMEIEITLHEQRGEAAAKVYESAGGYSPTVGIIGAVMGLIQVMKHLEDIKEVGHGIAVAFVATVYGVALANLFLLPAAAKIKARVHEETLLREMALEGVIGIIEGMNPKLIRSKLEAYVHSGSPDSAGRTETARKAAA